MFFVSLFQDELLLDSSIQIVVFLSSFSHAVDGLVEGDVLGDVLGDEDNDDEGDGEEDGEVDLEDDGEDEAELDGLGLLDAEEDGEADGEDDGEATFAGEKEAITEQYFSPEPNDDVATKLLLPAGVTAPFVS